MKKRKPTKIGVVCSMMILMFSLTVFAAQEGTMGTQRASSAEKLASSPEYGEYEAYGVYYNITSGYMTYNNVMLGYLEDEYRPGVFHIMNDAAGKLAIKAVRDEQGTLTGFEELENVEFINQISKEERKSAQMRPYVKAYEAYGVSCDAATGNLLYDGHTVFASYTRYSSCRCS